MQTRFRRDKKMNEMAIPKIFMQIAILTTLLFICFCVFEIYRAQEDIYYTIVNAAEEISDAQAALLIHAEAGKQFGLNAQSHGGRRAMVAPVPSEGGYAGPGYAGPDFSSEAYTGPGPAFVAAAQALSMDDNGWVALKGVISQRLGGREYLFADASGAIEAHIGPAEWMGQHISASDTVEIHGHIHKDRRRSHAYIHVERIIKQ